MKMAVGKRQKFKPGRKLRRKAPCIGVAAKVEALSRDRQKLMDAINALAAEAAREG